MSLQAWFLLGFVLFIVTVTWGMCLAAGRADDWAARMLAKAEAEAEAEAEDAAKDAVKDTAKRERVND